MKKLLDLFRMNISGGAQQESDKKSTGSTSRPRAEKVTGDTNSEVMPGRLFDYYGRVLYRPGELTERLK